MQLKTTPQKRYAQKFKKIRMTSVEFSEWMEKNNLSIPDTSMYLGICANQVTNYRDGTSKIPHPVYLACHYYGGVDIQTEPDVVFKPAKDWYADYKVPYNHEKPCVEGDDGYYGGDDVKERK